MDNHPIPQDVTGFKFRIIGSITVKQFLYLLGSGAAATVLIFLIPLNLIAKIPLIILLGGIGPFFAFFPIEGRPADMMLANFFKAVFANSLYTYQKQGVNLAIFPALNFTTAAPVQSQQNKETTEANRKRALLASALRSSHYSPDVGESERIQGVTQMFGNLTSSPSVARPPVTNVEQNVSGAQANQTQTQAPPTSVEIKHDPVSAQEQTTAPPSTSQEKSSASNQPQVDVKAAGGLNATPQFNDPSTDSILSAAFPVLPDRPNVVLGVVVDPRGKPLPNIIVEVEDASGTPVRTLKTGAGGQFAAATALPNGEYLMKFEDPRGNHQFDTMKMTLQGQIVQPVRVASVDAREKLRQELFG